MMLRRRLTYYLIGVGILALFFSFYFGYRAYQHYVDFNELFSSAITFQQTLDKAPHLGVDSTERQTAQRGGHTVPRTSRGATKQMEQFNTHRGDASPPVKVRILSPEKVALYSDGDPHGSVRLMNGPMPDIPDRTWSEEDMVSQLIEMPDGTVVKILELRGLEVKEGERVSPAYIESVRDKSLDYIQVGKTTHEVSAQAGDNESTRQYTIRKTLWADTLDASMEDIERMIANRELIVKLPPETMTPEETEINLNLLRAVRPDLYQVEQAGSWEIEQDEIDTWITEHLPESLPPGKVEPLHSVRPDSASASSRETDEVTVPTDEREGLSTDSFDKARQLIDQYGPEEGLRRLRESDPNAARQFERERKTPPARDESEVQ